MSKSVYKSFGYDAPDPAVIVGGAMAASAQADTVVSSYTDVLTLSNGSTFFVAWISDYSSTGTLLGVPVLYYADSTGTHDFNGVPTTFGETGNGNYMLTSTVGDGFSMQLTWNSEMPTSVGSLDVVINGVAATGSGGTVTDTMCFVAGTLVGTPAGQVAIESLKAGDSVMLSDGGRAPIRWIGRMAVATRFADRLRTMPIRIHAGALGDRMPARDLLVSPCHALLIDGALVQAGALVNGSTIVRERAMAEVFTYYHIELADHALILVEGVPAETFVDNADRMSFDNWAEHQALAGSDVEIVEMAYPRAKSARQVPAATRARLAARTGEMALAA